MADISEKVAATYKMVEEGAYFIVNRPRQYGKTTLLYTIADKLIASGEYVVFNISFEGIGGAIFKDEKVFSQGFVKTLSQYAFESAPELEAWLKSMIKKVNSLSDLSDCITLMVGKANKKVVLLIDEVDKSSNNDLFIHFLAVLRNKYLERKRIKTFHSVILAGVHDVKSLKLKIRPDSQSKYNSPWNIATIFEVEMNLQPAEIKPMLDDYVAERGVKMDTEWFANRLFFFTSGYPFLVSKLCKIIDENVLPKKIASGGVKEWTEEDLNKAYHLIALERNIANFDTLINNLEHYPELYELVFSLIFNGEKRDYSQYDPTVSLGTLHGILARSEEGYLVIQNRIYRELIADTMISKWKTSNSGNFNADAYGYKSQFTLPNGGLDSGQGTVKAK